MRFLLVAEADFAVDEAAAAKQLGERGPAGARRGASRARGARPSGRTTAIEAALSATLVDGLGLKPRNAFGPLRVAVTGATVSPPLFESMEILGRERSLARLAAAQREPERSATRVTGIAAMD